MVYRFTDRNGTAAISRLIDTTTNWNREHIFFYFYNAAEQMLTCACFELRFFQSYLLTFQLNRILMLFKRNENSYDCW